MKLGKKDLLYYLGLITMPIILISAMVRPQAISPTSSEFKIMTGKSPYYMRENVDIYANLISDGSPLANSLIGMEIDDPHGEPIIYRTLQTNSSLEGPIRIVNITSGRLASLFPLTFVAKTSFKIGELPDFNITIQNTSNENLVAKITACVYDSTNVFLNLSASSVKRIFAAGSSGDLFIQTAENIPSWVSIGEARVYVNAFNELGPHRIVPYSKEKSCSFTITNRVGAEPLARAPIFNPSRFNSTYSLTSRLGPYSIVGQYEIYATALHNYQTVLITFNVCYAEYPPQAIFTWAPPQPYVNQTVDFDASASTSSGGTIIKYEWDWESDEVFDATGITNSTKYETTGDHNVTLKVTDSSGKWAVSTRPITVLPPTPPEASFTFDPQNPRVNMTVNFDASSTTLGWDGTGFSPIVSYKWNFSDGNITIVSSPTITHEYLAPAAYNVTLNVTDAGGRWDTTWQVVNVTIGTGLISDVNEDGVVDIFDIVILAAQFGRPPPPITDPRADINKDGVVDIFDIVIVAADFGKTYP